VIHLQREFGLSYLFVAHDLAVVEHISHRIAVMYLGKSSRSRQDRPLHAPAAALYRGAPVGRPGPRPQRRRAEPDQPALGLPTPHALPLRLRPLLEGGAKMREVLPGHHIACHLREVPTAALAQAAAVGV
jgi:hypothetical protein